MTGFQDASIKAQEISITDTILNFVPKNIYGVKMTGFQDLLLKRKKSQSLIRF